MSELARIELSEKEEENLARDLQSSFGYFEKLKDISVNNLPAIATGENFESNLRKDELPSEPYADVADLVSVASETEEGYIKVKPVFER